jgi:queuosine precursor transporter
MRSPAVGLIHYALFVAMIPLANWMIGNWGAMCTPDGVCLVPVGFGLMAPSGILTAALALIFRDLVQFHLGRWWALSAIAAGGAMSWLVAPPNIVVASVSAFLVSELIDFLIYTRLQKRFLLAVFVSSAVGIVIDSTVFLLIAFGNLQYLLAESVGKLWMVIAATTVLALLHKRRGGEPPTLSAGAPS